MAAALFHIVKQADIVGRGAVGEIAGGRAMLRREVNDILGVVEPRRRARGGKEPGCTGGINRQVRMSPFPPVTTG